MIFAAYLMYSDQQQQQLNSTVAVVATHTLPDSAWPDSVAVIVTHILAVFAVVAIGPWKLGPDCAPSP